MIKVLFMLLLAFSLEAEASEQFKKCQGSSLEGIHREAVSLVEHARYLLDDEASEGLVNAGLAKYFKLSPTRTSDTPLIQKVLANIKRVAQKAQITRYRCHQLKQDLWCMAGQLAIVPPPKTTVHLCPAFFQKLHHQQQIGTVFHEWFHRWGGKHINYLPETYCRNAGKLEAKELIRNSDQYMLFLYYLGSNGEELECF